MMKRLLFIDSLRGFAIVCMILIHCALVLLKPSLHITTAYGLIEIFGSFAAPLFLFLVGFSLTLSKSNVKQQTKRGFILIVIGLLFMLLWDADILHFIGLFILISLALIRIRAELIIILGILLTLVSSSIRSIIGYTPFWSVVGWSQSATLTNILPQFLVAGFYPIFPWFAFTLLGIAMGKLYKSKTPLQTPALLTGVILVLTSIPLSRYLAITFYPASGLFILVQTGVILILFGATMSKKTGKSVLATFGKYSLSIYIMHVVFIILPFVLMGQEFKLNWAYYIINIVIWLPALFMGAKVLEEKNLLGPIEWLLKRI